MDMDEDESAIEVLGWNTFFSNVKYSQHVDTRAKFYCAYPYGESQNQLRKRT